MKSLVLLMALFFTGDKPPDELWHVKLLDCSGTVIQEWDTPGLDDSPAIQFTDLATGHTVRIEGTIILEQMR